MPDMTFFLLKPDVIKRNYVGQVLHRIEKHGFRIRAMKMVVVDQITIYEHYREHVGKDFFPGLVASMIDERVVAGVLVHHSGKTVERFRSLIGPYKDRVPGTLRGDFAINERENSVHGSDSAESAYREWGIWFPGEQA